jgi:fatty-acyl-CoA synthase
MPATIDTVLRWWSREQGERRALSLAGDAVTYAELDAWVGRVAARFADDMAPGDRLCVYAANSLEWCVAALATLRVGGVVAGINSRMVPAEVAYLLGDYAPKILVSDSDGGRQLDRIGELVSRTGAPVPAPKRMDVSEIAALRHGESRDVRRDVDREQASVIVTTSGSTARPKGVMWSHRTMLDYLAAYTLEDPIGPHPKILIVAPFTTSAGFIQFMQAIVQGGTGFLESQFDAEVALDLIVRERINIFCGAPIFFQRIADLPRFAEADVSCIEIAQTGGAAVPVALLKRWADKGVLVRQIYGQTELSGCATVNPRQFALSHPDKCGHGSPFKEIAILGADGKFLPAGEQGQIVFRGHGLMLGYWNDPEATAKTIVDGWLHTGDLGVIDELGLLKMVDRIKDIIISGGLNISAAEVERVLTEMEGIDEAAVIAVPDAKFGEVPLAIVHSTRPVTEAALYDHCLANLSKFKVPRYIVIDQEPLPRLATGKIAKPALRKRFAEAASLPAPAR